MVRVAVIYVMSQVNFQSTAETTPRTAGDAFTVHSMVSITACPLAYCCECLDGYRMWMCLAGVDGTPSRRNQAPYEYHQQIWIGGISMSYLVDEVDDSVQSALAGWWVQPDIREHPGERYRMQLIQA